MVDQKKLKNINFRADEATLEAIDVIAATLIGTDGGLSSNAKSRAIRKAILETAARIREVSEGGK